MNPSRNNQNPNSNNQGNHFSQNNMNFLNANQPTFKRINQDQDEYLLEDCIDDVTGEVFTRKTPSKQNLNLLNNNNGQTNPPIQFQGYQNNQTNYPPQMKQSSVNPSYQQIFISDPPQNNQVFYDFNHGSNQQFNQVFPPQQQSRVQNTNALSRASKLDQSLMMIFRQNQQQLESGFSSKGNSKIEEKSKKAVSRLSHQFFGKSGNPEENMKSKKKTRQTVSTFGFDYKKDFLPSKNEEPIPNYENNQFLRPINVQIQHQKMQIEQTHSIIENQQVFGNSPSNKNKGFQNLVAPQNRMSEVKRKRQRLSSGMEGLTKFLKVIGSEKQEKKPSPPPSKSQTEPDKSNRVTMDMNSLLSFLQSTNNENTKPSGQSEKDFVQPIVPIEKQKESKQINTGPQISQNIRHQTKNMKPLMQVLGNVILEDQNEDQVTPMKSPLRERSIAREQSIKKLDINFARSDRKSLHQFALQSERKLISNASKDQYTRQIFNRYFCNLNERINQQKQTYEELTRQKTQIIKQINNKLSQYTINSEKLAEWREEQQKIRQKIYAIKQKVNKSQFDNNSQVIYKFEETFGIQLHRLQKTSPDDGFFIEFTYDDMLLRIFRSHKKNQTQCKFMQRLVYSNTKKYFQFSFEEKAAFIKAFTAIKMKYVKNLTAFMIQLIRYIKAIQKFELTMAHYAIIDNCVSDFRFADSNTEIEFVFTSGLKFDFLFSVDIIELLDNGGIKIYSGNEDKNIQIPDEFLKLQNGGNKIGKCFIFVERYVAQSVMRQVEDATNAK